MNADLCELSDGFSDSRRSAFICGQSFD